MAKQEHARQIKLGRILKQSKAIRLRLSVVAEAASAGQDGQATPMAIRSRELERVSE
jgi:hypothetical protein